MLPLGMRYASTRNALTTRKSRMASESDFAHSKRPRAMVPIGLRRGAVGGGSEMS